MEINVTDHEARIIHDALCALVMAGWERGYDQEEVLSLGGRLLLAEAE